MNQRGISLIEAAMFLALSAVVVSGAIYYFNAAQESENRQVVIGKMKNIVSYVNKYYMSNGNNKPYTGLNNEFLAKTVPGLVLNSSGNIELPSGMDLIVNESTDPYYSYNVEVHNIPRLQCQEYVTIFVNLGDIRKGWVRNHRDGSGGWGAYNGSPNNIKERMLTACQNWYKTGPIDLAIALTT